MCEALDGPFQGARGKREAHLPIEVRGYGLGSGLVARERRTLRSSNPDSKPNGVGRSAWTACRSKQSGPGLGLGLLTADPNPNCRLKEHPRRRNSTRALPFCREGLEEMARR